MIPAPIFYPGISASILYCLSGIGQDRTGQETHPSHLISRIASTRLVRVTVQRQQKVQYIYQPRDRIEPLCVVVEDTALTWMM